MRPILQPSASPQRRPSRFCGSAASPSRPARTAWSAARWRLRCCARRWVQASSWWCRASARRATAAGDQARTMTPAQAVAAGADWIVVGRPITGAADPGGGGGHRRQHRMTQVKICGINDPSAFDAAVEAGADWVGFVFFPPSPRFVTPGFAAPCRRGWHGGPPRVGLFVEPTEAAIAEVFASRETGCPADLWRSGPPRRDQGAVRPAGLARHRHQRRRRPADRAPMAPTACCWKQSRRQVRTAPAAMPRLSTGPCCAGWTAPAPWMLAGGLTPDNVALAISETGAAAVDVSSGVERARA